MTDHQPPMTSADAVTSDDAGSGYAGLKQIARINTYIRQREIAAAETGK